MIHLPLYCWKDLVVPFCAAGHLSFPCESYPSHFHHPLSSVTSSSYIYIDHSAVPSVKFPTVLSSIPTLHCPFVRSSLIPQSSFFRLQFCPTPPVHPVLSSLPFSSSTVHEFRVKWISIYAHKQLKLPLLNFMKLHTSAEKKYCNC